MIRRSVRLMTLGAAAAIGVSALTPAAQAEDFFSALFGGFERPHAPPRQAPVYSSDSDVNVPQGRSHNAGGGQAYCVRTCDGRYFPLQATGNETRAASCNSFCPASETKVVYGGNIDSATTDTGKPYSELPNAFRFRNEIVAGCTCTGKTETGLAPVKIENDPTLRSGDIVAGADGLVVARHGDRRGASADFTPVPRRESARIEGAPVVASE